MDSQQMEGLNNKQTFRVSPHLPGTEFPAKKIFPIFQFADNFSF